jgi:diguanylate cyclase
MEEPAVQDEVAERPQEEGLRFARGMYPPRVLGVALGALCIGGGLWQQGAPAAAWIALLVNTLAWPHVALSLARRSRNPYRAELRNLMVDSAFGGAWVAVIGLNLVPSAVLIAMLAMDKACIGGLRFLARCLAAQAFAAAAVALAVGFELRLETALPAMIASLPLLIIYPVTVGRATYRLSRELRSKNVLLAALSSTDGLSGLLNRRCWEEAAANEFARCRRIGHPSALMMLDIDHFKTINDRDGHPAGDRVIREVAALLRDTLRHHDIPGRYGGDEFGVVLAGTDARGAPVIAERIRKRIESAVLEPRHRVRTTVSIGTAVLDRGDANYLDWIARADRALYAAKGAGRNRAVHADPAPAPAL